MVSIKDQFLLDPAVAFLNHGSFGATPRPVFEAYQGWQRQLERQPVAFLGRELMDHLRKARKALGSFLKAPASDLAFVVNATYGVNLIARSLSLNPGDEVLTSDHEYGACENVWSWICRKQNARLVRQKIPLQAQQTDDFVDCLWQGVTSRTKVIFLSHITSPTALEFPVAQVCRKAKEHGILTVIDGAHGPGQIPVDLGAIGPDFYAGNCHKWMLGPKGSGFIYTREPLQELIEPLVISWGWSDGLQYPADSRYHNLLQWGGTFDPAAFLSVPAAIAFQQENDWDFRVQTCHQLLAQALERIEAVTGYESLYGKASNNFHQLGAARIPYQDDLLGCQEAIFERHKVEVPLIEFGDVHLVRVSVQVYNSESDIERLIRALRDTCIQA